MSNFFTSLLESLSAVTDQPPVAAETTEITYVLAQCCALTYELYLQGIDNVPSTGTPVSSQISGPSTYQFSRPDGSIAAQVETALFIEGFDPTLPLADTYQPYAQQLAKRPVAAPGRTRVSSGHGVCSGRPSAPTNKAGAERTAT